MPVRGVEKHTRPNIGSAVKVVYQAAKVVLGIPSGTCRYHPSCSSYADEAFRRYPLWRAVLMSVWRILRCHPWARGGYDPVR